LYFKFYTQKNQSLISTAQFAVIFLYRYYYLHVMMCWQANFVQWDECWCHLWTCYGHRCLPHLISTATLSCRKKHLLLLQYARKHIAVVGLLRVTLWNINNSNKSRC